MNCSASVALVAGWVRFPNSGCMSLPSAENRLLWLHACSWSNCSLSGLGCGGCAQWQLQVGCRRDFMLWACFRGQCGEHGGGHGWVQAVADGYSGTQQTWRRRLAAALPAPSGKAAEHEVVTVTSWFAGTVKQGKAGTGKKAGPQGRKTKQGGRPSWSYRQAPTPSEKPKANGSRCVAVNCFYVLGLLP